MTDLLAISAGNLLSPMVLFFALGLAAGWLKSDLAIPEPLSKGLSLYLMMSIGFRGGVELAHHGAGGAVLPALATAVALSFLMPLLAFGMLRTATRLGAVDAAAVAAHYGSVSVVTFVSAAAFLASQQVPYEGWVVAMLALMETPAIVSGLLLARLGGAPARAPKRARGLAALGVPPELLREVLVSGSVVLLLGSFAIGRLTGDGGLATMAPLLEKPFKGALAVFLLDMGLLAARRMSGMRGLEWRVAAFGIAMPLVGGAIGLGAAQVLGMSVGGATLLAVLAASASYIVVPAAMRLALPQAEPAIYVTLSLGITFPFNLTLGIPLYYLAAKAIAGA